MSVVKGIPHTSHLCYSEQHDRYTIGTPRSLLAIEILSFNLLMRINT